MDTAAEWFYRYGFSKVTMDELAEKMAMSKKTLYKYFASKDDIVKELVDSTIKLMEVRCSSIAHNSEIDLVDRLKQMMTFVAMQYSKIGKSLLEDLQKNAPHIWKQIDAHRRENILVNFGNMLKEGQEKGIFRKDIDKDLILLIYSNIVQNIINPDVLVQIPYSAAQVFEAVSKILYEGIMTEEGRAQYFNQKTLVANHAG